MKVWRICKERYAESAFDGEGAKRVGGRWNSRGLRLAYASENLSLATLELLVHLELEDSPPEMVAVPALVPGELGVETLEPADLPTDWRRVDGHPELKARGNSWLSSQATPLLKVPSAVIPEEYNVLVNPEHPAFEAIDVGLPQPFDFDARLF